MPSTYVIDELYTRVKNTSGSTKTFTFFGYSVTLADGAVHNYRGDLVCNLGMLAHQGQTRWFDKLAEHLDAGDIQILSRPMPLFYDATNDDVKGLAVDGGLLGLVNPTWAEGEPSSFTGVDT